ncbi:MAG: 50S ribosomal protein L17 [Mycobacterium leprae]
MSAYQKLGRDSSARKALFRAVVTALFDKERIETTEAKAMEIKGIAEEFITLAKRNDLHARRQAMAFIYDESVVKKLFENIAPRYADRNGGYTRVTKTAPRRGDAAPMAILELV